jgi:mono/diheme cytochrome c family protein
MGRPLYWCATAAGSALLLIATWGLPRAEAAAAAAPTPEQESSIALGRSLFTERCAKCHDEDAGRKLPDGRSLVERLSHRSDLKEALAGRLKGMTEEQRRGILAYVGRLVDKSRASGAAETLPGSD